MPASYPIESVGNSARILLMLREHPALRVATVAGELGVARSTAHRMLTTLQEAGLLSQNRATKEYCAGPALVEIGIAVVGSSDIRAASRSVLELIAQETGETAHLLVLEGTEIVFVDGVEGRHVVRAVLRIGHRGAAHASAAGKALLAELSKDELRLLYPGSKLTGGTASALVTRRELEQELERVRQLGYATNFSESEPDLTAVAVTLHDSRGITRGALSVSGPAQRLGTDLTATIDTLREQARQLGNRLS